MKMHQQVLVVVSVFSTTAFRAEVPSPECFKKEVSVLAWVARCLLAFSSVRRNAASSHALRNLRLLTRTDGWLATRSETDAAVLNSGYDTSEMESRSESIHYAFFWRPPFRSIYERDFTALSMRFHECSVASGIRSSLNAGAVAGRACHGC